GKACSNGKCGIIPPRGSTRYFHTKACRNTYEKVAKNHQKLKEAYDILTGQNNPPSSGGGGGQTSDQPRTDNCSRCGKEYDFDRNRYQEHKKGKGENEYF
ncbi:MAG: hypothetical protein NY202_05285, partial [Mollicutes bacterium UO1]